MTKGEWERNGSPLILGRSGLWVFGESYFYIILNISIIKTKPREAMRACGARVGAGPAQGLDFGPTVLIWGLLWAPLCSRSSAGHTTAFPKPGKPTSVLDPTPWLPVLFPRNLLKLLDGGRLSHSPRWCRFYICAYLMYYR